MFCPGCKKEFKIDGDELQILSTGIRCPSYPTCKATISFATLKEWVKVDIKKLKEEMVKLNNTQVHLEEAEADFFEKERELLMHEGAFPLEAKRARAEYEEAYKLFCTEKERWCYDIAQRLKEESMLSHVILDYLLAQKRRELEEKRKNCELDDLSSGYRDKFLGWRARRDSSDLETDPLFHIAPDEKITTVLKSNDKPDYKIVNNPTLPFDANISKHLVFLSDKIWVELFAVWMHLNEDKEYLMEKAESLLAADQLDSNWYREEVAWVDLHDSLIILEPQWCKDIDMWLAYYGESSLKEREACAEKLTQVKRKRSQEVK